MLWQADDLEPVVAHCPYGSHQVVEGDRFGNKGAGAETRIAIGLPFLLILFSFIFARAEQGKFRPPLRYVRSTPKQSTFRARLGMSQIDPIRTFSQLYGSVIHSWDLLVA